MDPGRDAEGIFETEFPIYAERDGLSSDALDRSSLGIRYRHLGAVLARIEKYKVVISISHMRFIPRLLGEEVWRAARHFPALIVTGPRRAGKTTLLRHLFPDAEYRLLEDPDVVARIRSDPRGFMEGGLIRHLATERGTRRG